MCVCCFVSVDEGTSHSRSQLECSSQLFLCCVNALAYVRSAASIALRLSLSPSYPNHNYVNQLKARLIAASERSTLWRAGVAGYVIWPMPCIPRLTLLPLVPCAALGLGRDGTNNLALSRLESWAIDACGKKDIFSFRRHKVPTQTSR